MSEGFSKFFHGSVGVGGTIATWRLGSYHTDIAACAGLCTIAWMLRQLWLSFRKKK